MTHQLTKRSEKMIIQIHTNPELFVSTSDEDYSNTHVIVRQATQADRSVALHTFMLDEIVEDPAGFRDLACKLIRFPAHVIRLKTEADDVPTPITTELELFITSHPDGTEDRLYRAIIKEGKMIKWVGEAQNRLTLVAPVRSNGGSLKGIKAVIHKQDYFPERD